MKIHVALFLLFSLVNTSKAAPRAIDQFPDLAKLPDSSAELQDAIDNRQLLPAGVHRITKPLEVDLSVLKSAIIRPASGAVTLIMDGPGPAIRLSGSHEGSAAPKSFKAATWHQRMPVISDLEIVGNHRESIGIELVGTVQPIVSKVAVRWCHHGIRVAVRNRNIAISDCQLYENSGVGLFLDDVNLHQINVSNSHISYNREGGIVVRDGNVRNLQITGCDIEANMPGNSQKTEAANIFIDVSTSEFDKSKSIAEVAITGCTIQHSANYGQDGQTIAPGGANIRLRGKEIWPIDSVTITGNVISDTCTSIDIDRSMDVTISGNTFFAPKPANLLVSNSKRILVNGNTFNPRQFERPGTIQFENSVDCVISNCILNDFKTKDGALILKNCEGFQVRGNVLTGCESGIRVVDSRDSNIHDNLFRKFTGKEKIEVDSKSSDLSIRQ